MRQAWSGAPHAMELRPRRICCGSRQGNTYHIRGHHHHHQQQVVTPYDSMLLLLWGHGNGVMIVAHGGGQEQRTMEDHRGTDAAVDGLCVYKSDGW